MFSVALALLLVPILSQATEILIDGTGDIEVISGEVVVVDDGLSEAAIADTSLADDTTLTDDDTISIDSPNDDGTTSEEATNEEDGSEYLDPIDDDGSEEAISEPGGPGDIPPVEEPVNTTPLPSTLVLLGSGLLALSGLAWRRNNKR